MNLLKKKKKRIKVEIYSKDACHLCDLAKEILFRTQQKIAFDIKEIDITRDSILYEEYKDQIPVIFINGRKSFKYRISEKELYKKLKRLT